MKSYLSYFKLKFITGLQYRSAALAGIFTQLFFGFIYIVETVSVILQVWFFKKTKGSRLFRMTPLHHHFELLGYSENKIDLLFWTISVFTTIIGIILGVKIF